MLATLARKTLDFYTAPARFALRQTRRNIEAARQLGSEIRQFREELDQLSTQIIDRASREMGLDLDAMSPEERMEEARRAAQRAEVGMSAALGEALKALILLSVDDRTPLPQNDRGRVIEGDYQRVR